MDCKFAEKVSLLIDGELPPAETQRVKKHIAGCADCGQLEKDFLYLRQQIKESVAERPALAAETPRSNQPAVKKAPFWKKQVFLPAPAFLLLLLVLALFGIWAITANLNQLKERTVVEDSAKKTPVEKQPLQNPPQPPPAEISLSRFDKGGRTEIYTVRRQNAAESEKLRSIKQ